MTHPEAPTFDLPRDDLMRAAAALRAVAAAIRTVRERRGRAAFSDPEHAARLRAVADRNALLPFDAATAREWNAADRGDRVRGAAHPDTGMTVRVTELSRGRFGVQAGWEGNHVETVVGDHHLARQLAQWLMADPTVDRLDELRSALDPRVPRPAADRAAAAQAWGSRHDPLWLAHWHIPGDLVRAWRQATGRDPVFNADLAAARANAAATDPDWYREWWDRHSDAPTPGTRHLAELEIIHRHGRNAARSDPTAAPTDRRQAAADASAEPHAPTGAETSTGEHLSAHTEEPEFDQARAWVSATDPTWFDTWSWHYDWADTRDGRRTLEDDLVSRWRRRGTDDSTASQEHDGLIRAPMTRMQASILTKAGRQPDPATTWVEASLLIDEVRGTPRGKKAGEWLREHGLAAQAADNAVAAAVAKLYPADDTAATAPETAAPSTAEEIGDWFRRLDPDYFRQWSLEHATARDQFRHQRQLEKLWAQITGRDRSFTADLAAARFQAANNDPDAAHRYHEEHDQASSPTARHELDSRLIRRWHPRHSFRADNYFHAEPTPTLAQMLRGRVSDQVLDHPRWTTAEDTFAGLVQRGAAADALADAVAAVDFDNGRIRAPSGYASWVMTQTANATIPETGSDADHRRLVAEWLAAADPANPINRSIAAQLVGEFDAGFDADIARIFPGILDGDARHHSQYDEQPDTTLLDATDRVFVVDATGTAEPTFHTADHIVTVDTDGHTDILATIDRTFVGDRPTQIAYRRPEDPEPATTERPDEPDETAEDALSRAAAPLTPPAEDAAATAKPAGRQSRPAGKSAAAKAAPTQRRRRTN